MTPERWRQIEDLCHAALAYPSGERAAFLAQTCGDDDALRREVETLVAQEAKAATFLSVPAAAAAGLALQEPASERRVGERFGIYTIRELLGVGGMGQVYRAYDDTLGREVAIKVLPPAFTAHPERRARFEREARMLATLNHPHIGAIYSVEEADGVRGLVLELVEGQTLAERIASAPRGIPVTEALGIARQIADALDAAHERGIIHRDLKPTNIKITPDGVVKVLDFGLAKASSADGVPPDLAESRLGVVLGTAAYMSPEQARGHSVDKRGDIWAFGCVLYEMLAGRLAFPGDTASDTIAKILEREPDWSALPAATPAPIRRLLLRCIAKDPKRRLRDIGDARIEIDGLGEVLPGVEADRRPLSTPGKRHLWLPWAAVMALAAGVVAWEARPRTTPDTLLADAHFSRLTDWEGTEVAGEISPDGKFVAFMSDAAGEFDIWLKQVGTGGFRNLTESIHPLTTPGVLKNFGFSGDGAEIWLSTSNDAGGPKTLIPLTGGTPRPFLGKGDAAPAWSFDDTRVAYFNNAPGDPLFVADRTGGDATRLVVPNAPGERAFFDTGLHTHNPAWSADGQWIYFVHGPDPTDDMDIWRMRPTGGRPERMTQQNVSMNYLTALGPRLLLYTARAEDGSGPWLWTVDVDRRVPQRVATGLEVYTHVSASRDGRRVIATVGDRIAGLWSVPLLDRRANDRDVRPYLDGRALAPRFGGTSLFYLSARGSEDGLWRLRDGNASEVWKTRDGTMSEPPAVSPDGRQVAVVVTENGKRRLMVMSDEGTGVRTLAPSLDIQGASGRGMSDWSPDGAWIVAGGRDAHGPGLFKIPVDGGSPVRLVSGEAISPEWSPAGNLIVYAGALIAGRVPLLGVTPDGVPVSLPETLTHIGGGHRFLPDGSGVVYLPLERSTDFWLLDLAAKTTRPLTSLSDQGRLNMFDVTPDGKQLVFDRVREKSDIVLIEIPK